MVLAAGQALGPRPVVDKGVTEAIGLFLVDAAVRRAPGYQAVLRNVYAGTVIVLGMTVFLGAAAQWAPREPARFAVYLLLSALATAAGTAVPQLAGSMSVSFAFVLASMVEMTLPEALVVGCMSVAVSAAFQGGERRELLPALFHCATAAVVIRMAYSVCHTNWVLDPELNSLMRLLLGSSTLYVLSNFTAASVRALAEERRLWSLWREYCFWTFPYFVAGTAFTALVQRISAAFGWQVSLLILPAALIVYVSAHSYVGRLSRRTAELEAMTALQRRTIEALALAIEAKDQTGPMHLARLETYSLAIGREMGLNETELDALRAAAMLHDVGKLAVPDHILSKEGRLSQEEFDKIKIHPVAGAGILERVRFPSPVALLVRFHHEKWNGGGYPAGLKGEAIPLGSRILAVVDTLDALITDRPYRPAISLGAAVARISTDSGVSFDPQVVAILRRRYVELEAAVLRRWREAEEALNAGMTAHAGLLTTSPGPPEFLDSIAAARREAQDLLELSQEMGKSLHLEETLEALTVRLRRIIGFEALVIYLPQDRKLYARFAWGESQPLFLSRQVEMGQGLSGWVAQHRQPVFNGDVALELGEGHKSILRSALAVPLAGGRGPAGVLLLCRAEPKTFSRDDLRLLTSVSAKLGATIENAVIYEQAAATAATDYLTGLPNARALAAQLESEVARSRRMGSPVTVLVCDLDGFKLVNDRFGHPQGDEVLRAVARALRLSVREYDFVARMGGDEFVLLLPGLAEADVALKIEQLRQVVREACREASPESQVELSVGQARCPRDESDPEALLALADQHMYQAKQQQKGEEAISPRGFDFDWPSGPAQS